MSIVSNLIDDLRNKARNLRMAADRLDHAKGEVSRREDDLRHAAKRHSEAHKSAAREVIIAWLLAQTESMTVEQEHAFIAKVADALHCKWHPYGGSVANEYSRMDWLRDIGVEIFGEHIELFVVDPVQYQFDKLDRHAPDTQKEIQRIAYSLMTQHLEGALKTCYIAISTLWRAEPNENGDWRKEFSWRRARGGENIIRYVTPSVFQELARAKRIKQNGVEWARFSHAEWSFRNRATADADIAKAIDAVIGVTALAKAA